MICDFCGKEFDSRRSLNIHIGLEHKGEDGYVEKKKKMISVTPKTIEKIKDIRKSENLSNFSEAVSFIAERYRSNRNIEKRLLKIEEKVTDIEEAVMF